MLQVLVRRATRWAYSGNTFIARGRARRMQQMLDLLRPPPKARVIDLGGTEYVWNLVPNDFHVTLVNIPGFNPPVTDPTRFVRVEADACDLRALFADGSFDLAFSNSVIEHVGDEPRQQMFADEARRIGKAYWVQTPSDRFPIEAHSGVPYYWRLPQFVKNRLHRGWQKKLPGWYDMFSGTRVLSRQRMRDLFPDGRLFIEKRMGFEKSYAAYRPTDAGAPAEGRGQSGATGRSRALQAAMF